MQASRTICRYEDMNHLQAAHRRAARTHCSTWSTLRHVETDQLPVTQVEIASILPNPRQPRREFAEEDLASLTVSIQHEGVIQPLVVRRAAEDSYELIAGERRLRAAALAGLSRVPVVVNDVEDAALLRVALIENLQRVDLTPIEEAQAYEELLLDTGLTQGELAGLLGKSRQWISHHLGLLKLPETVQRKVAAGVLSRGHAKALVGLDDPEKAEALADRIVREGLTVRNVEEIILLGDLTGTRTRAQPARAARPIQDFTEVSETLGEWLETRVKVLGNRRKGKIIVEFSSPDDLDRLLAVMAEPAPRLVEGRTAP